MVFEVARNTRSTGRIATVARGDDGRTVSLLLIGILGELAEGLGIMLVTAPRVAMLGNIDHTISPRLLSSGFRHLEPFVVMVVVMVVSSVNEVNHFVWGVVTLRSDGGGSPGVLAHSDVYSGDHRLSLSLN